MLTLIDYHNKQVVATFNGSNANNKQLRAWIAENGYLVHSQSRNVLILIK